MTRLTAGDLGQLARRLGGGEVRVHGHGDDENQSQEEGAAEEVERALQHHVPIHLGGEPVDTAEGTHPRIFRRSDHPNFSSVSFKGPK